MNKNVSNPPALKIGCVLMASGEARRFGRDKLLEPFNGRPLLVHGLEQLRACSFSKLVVVTRSPEQLRLSKTLADEVVYHHEAWRSDSVRLGIERMGEMDVCMFCVADQPLLSAASLEKLMLASIQNPQAIIRLYWHHRPGNPILFPRSLFAELSALPQDEGGSFVARKYPEQLVAVQSGCENELSDADTPESLARLEKIFMMKKFVQNR